MHNTDILFNIGFSSSVATQKAVTCHRAICWVHFPQLFDCGKVMEKWKDSIAISSSETR
jgi:hypothetical protein